MKQEQTILSVAEMLELLPTSWDNLKLKDYVKLGDLKITETDEDGFNGVDNTLKILSALTGQPISYLEDLALASIQQLARKLDFMVEMPKLDEKKSKIKWKTIEEVSYNDFVTFYSLQKDMINNLPMIIKSFSKDPLTDEQVNDMSTQDAMNGFLLLKKTAQKSLKCSIRKERLKLVKFLIKDKLTHYKQKLKASVKL